MINKKTYTVLASLTGLTLALTLVGCSTPKAENTTETIPLSSTPALTEFPVFSAKDKDLPKGWTTKETVDEETGSKSVIGQVSDKYIFVQNDDSTCSFTASIYSGSSSNAGHGDDYNSKNLLYPKNISSNTVMVKEKTITAAATKSKISMASGEYTLDSYNTNGEVSGKTNNISAVRTFSVVLPNGYIPFEPGPMIMEDGTVSEEISSEPVPTEDSFGNPLDEGIPVVEYTLSCDENTTMPYKEWNSLINSVDLTLNIAAKK